MMLKRRSKRKEEIVVRPRRYSSLLVGMADLLEDARRASARSVNAIMTATYWEIGRRIVEFEQVRRGRAEYGKRLIDRLSVDLCSRFGRGFSARNLRSFRGFYLAWPSTHALGADFAQPGIWQTASARSETKATRKNYHKLAKKPDPAAGEIWQTLSAKSEELQIASQGSRSRALSSSLRLSEIARRFPLPWSHYVRLLSVKEAEARSFYETEALRGGWSVRQLDRQIATSFYERTAMSRNKIAMIRRGEQAKDVEIVTPEEEIKDPLVLEFLGLKDEYSETVLEESLVRHLESFLLELGNDFAFIARQKRLRVGDEWYRIDLMFFHRRLRCLILIDLKIGKFTHADAGQMNLYLNYAREHWTHGEETRRLV